MMDASRVQRMHAKDVRAELERMEMGDLIRHGNVYEIFKNLPTGGKITHEHLKLFFHDEWLQFGAHILKNDDVYAPSGAYYDVADPQAAVQPPTWDMHAALSSGEQEMLGQAFSRGSGFGKAMTKQVASADDGGQTIEGVTSAAEGTLGELDDFMGEMQMSILDAQMLSDYRSRMEETMDEVKRLIALAKQGAIDPSFILVALAKVNATKNGVLFSWLGKKAFHVNETLNQVSEDIVRSGGTDFGTMEEGRSKTREGSFQMQLLVTDMQKVMQDATSVLEQVKSYMEDINRTKREIITKVAAQ